MSDPQFNPYSRHGPSLENAATRVFAIAVPADDTDANTVLPQVCKALRIFNPDGAASHTLTYVTVNGDSVTITIPANSVWKEDVVITKVMHTGTYAGLLIHGYSDNTY